MRILLLFPLAFLLSGCAGFTAGAAIIGNKWSGYVADYCALPSHQRKFVRGVANKPLKNGLIMISCKDDQEFQELHTSYVLPYTDGDIYDAIISTVLENGGSYTLPNGDVIRLTVDAADDAAPAE